MTYPKKRAFSRQAKSTSFLLLILSSSFKEMRAGSYALYLRGHSVYIESSMALATAIHDFRVLVY